MLMSGQLQVPGIDSRLRPAKESTKKCTTQPACHGELSVDLNGAPIAADANSHSGLIYIYIYES